jgi:hypothetical protein
VAFLFGFIFYTHTQPAIRTTISSDDYRFGGSMTDEIFQKLRSDEQKAYLIALDSLVLKNDSISWADSESINQLASDENSCSQKNLWINTNDFIAEIEIIREVKYSLDIPRYMIFFKREDGVSYYTFQIYY